VVRALGALGAPLALDERLGPVAPHGLMLRALGAHFVKGAVLTLEVKRRVVPRLEVPPLLHASACCPQWRLRVQQQFAPVPRPSRARP